MTAPHNARAAPRSIAIVGNGPVALVAAIAFARALPQARIALIDTPADPAALADRFPLAPAQTAAFLATLGLDERTLVAAGATHRIGERFDWGGAPFAVSLGERLPIVAGAALHQLWLARGAAGGFDTLLPGATLAIAERFTHPSEDPRSPLAGIDYALRLDAIRPLLDARLRATRLATKTIRIERDGDSIAALLLDDGTRIAADLFVDASGPAALLAAPEAAWIDWSAALPVDRLLLANGPLRPSPTDRYAATGIGWTATWSLADRTQHALGYAATVTNDARAARQFGKPVSERLAIVPRRRARPFAGNVLALGDAAAAVGPLGWLGFPLACAHLALALELLPHGSQPLLITEYNRRATDAADRVRDYVAAYYLAAASKGEFWHALRTRIVPEGLAAALTQFRRRGALPPVEDSLLDRGDWIQALLGLGIRPDRVDPIAQSVSAVTADATLATIRTGVAGLPAKLAPYPDYLTRMRR